MSEPDSNPADCPRCQALEQRVKALEEVVRQLTEKIEAQQREQKKQTVRFPKNKRKTSPKKPGRKGGHSQQKRAIPEVIDREVDVPVPAHCPDCQIPWEITTHTQYQTDIPPVKPTITKFNIQVGNCSCCGMRIQGRHEDQVSDALGSANHVLGPQVQALAARLKHQCGTSYQKICDLLKSFFQFQTCPGTLARAGERFARKAGSTFAGIQEKLRQSSVVHADETGWRVGTESAWLWVFCNSDYTLFEVAPCRGHEVVGQNLGPGFEGVLVCDGLSSYDPLPWDRQRCQAHLLRRMAALSEQWENRCDSDELFWEIDELRCLKELLTRSEELKQQRDLLPAVEYQQQTEALRQTLSDWIEINDPHFFSETEETFQRLVRHVQKHEEEWLRFLEHGQVDRTNNLAERQIRWGVITRKVGGCNQSWRGSRKTSVLSSLLASCVQQGRSFLSLVRQTLLSRAPTVIDLATLPAV